MLSYLLLVPMLPNVQENMFFDGSISLVNFFNMWKWYHLESCNWVESGSEKPSTFGCFLKKKVLWLLESWQKLFKSRRLIMWFSRSFCLLRNLDPSPNDGNYRNCCYEIHNWEKFLISLIKHGLILPAYRFIVHMRNGKSNFLSIYATVVSSLCCT